jgi:hypothetical protein
MAVLAVIGFFLRGSDRDTMQTFGSWIAVALLAVGLIPLSGCRICADCEDLAYPAYGGAWQRTQRYSGRVGSIFDPAGAQAPNLVNRDQPPTPDELERAKQEARDSGLDDFDRPGDEQSPESNSDLPPATDPTEELRQRDLDDIRNEKEEDLRKKQLDDINVRLIPGSNDASRMR